MDTGLGRAQGDAKRGRHLLERQIQVVAKDQDGAVFHLLVGERALDLVTIDDGAEVVGGDPGALCRTDIGQFASGALGLRVADMDQDAA